MAKRYKTMVTPKIETIFILNDLTILHDDYKVVGLFGVTIVLHLVKILSGSRNFCLRYTG